MPAFAARPKPIPTAAPTPAPSAAPGKKFSAPVQKNYTEPPKGTAGKDFTRKHPSVLGPGRWADWEISQDPYNPSSGNFWFSRGNEYFIVDPNKNYIGGSINTQNPYADWVAGVAPDAGGTYEDAESIQAAAQAQLEKMAGLANTQQSRSNLESNFIEANNALGRAKKKSIGSLADATADRGLTNSGIYLKSTDDVNDTYFRQGEGLSRNKLQQENALSQQEMDIGNRYTQAVNAAKAAAFQRKRAAWQKAKEDAITRATEALGL